MPMSGAAAIAQMRMARARFEARGDVVPFPMFRENGSLPTNCPRCGADTAGIIPGTTTPGRCDICNFPIAASGRW